MLSVLYVKVAERFNIAGNGNRPEVFSTVCHIKTLKYSKNSEKQDERQLD
jgi:hypothetical protein